ncbi:MAG: IncP-type DNA transfer coupling protein TraG [Proteobacteria bacterium]|nr:MAG: IncP-type DNA transfer coupling protein TraG [Pseudomonadota bacterium]
MGSKKDKNKQSPFLDQDPPGFFGSRVRAYKNLHGSARFANLEDILQMDLLAPLSKDPKAVPKRGVYVGGYMDGDTFRYLQHDGPEHVLAFAPTRSGKGVGLVIPTLLTWLHSTVVLDIKGENYALTSGHRQKHLNNIVLRFDPTRPTGSVKFNPLAEIRLGTMFEVSDVQNIAMMIVDPDGKGLNDHWAKTGYSLIVGVALHCLYVQKKNNARIATLSDIADCLTDPSMDIKATLEKMMMTHHLDGTAHPVVARCARAMLNKADAELSGVLSTATSFLTLYTDPIVAENTSYSEFSISDLMNNEKPVSLYIVIPPSDKDRLKPLVRLLVNQIVRTLCRDMDFENGASKASYKHRLLLMLDEFPSLGKLEIFEESLAFIAGYGLKAYLICQDVAQLEKAYSEYESITSNCHIRIAYAPNKIKTARVLSEMLGETTIDHKTVSQSKGGALFATPSYTTAMQEVKRPLMTTDEVSRLPSPLKREGKIIAAGDMLIFVAGFPAIYGKQILYFKHDFFMKRAMIKAPQTDRCDSTHQEELNKRLYTKETFA